MSFSTLFSVSSLVFIVHRWFWYKICSFFFFFIYRFFTMLVPSPCLQFGRKYNFHSSILSNGSCPLTDSVFYINIRTESKMASRTNFWAIVLPDFHIKLTSLPILLWLSLGSIRVHGEYLRTLHSTVTAVLTVICVSVLIG